MREGSRIRNARIVGSDATEWSAGGLYQNI